MLLHCFEQAAPARAVVACIGRSNATGHELPAR